MSNLESPSHRGFRAGLDFYLPILSLYEFFVVLLALIGALGVLTLRIRSRLATGALVWSSLAVAFYLWTPARSPVFVLQMIVPMALLGAFVIGYLHHTAAWSIVRYPVALLALLTLCVQVANNFVWYAPDASQAPWARTALLYWTEPATTLQTPVQCARVAGEVPPHGASVFFAADSPVLRWYLRALTPAATAEGATAIVGGVEASLSQAQGLTSYEFELSDTWHPEWWSLSPRATLNYLLSARAWTPLDPRRVTIAVRPIITVAPTVIWAPVGPPAPAESAASATPGTEASPAPSASSTPASVPAADNHPLSTPASTATSTPTVTPVATPAATAAATPTAAPAATPSATPARTHAATASGKRAGRHSRHAR